MVLGYSQKFPWGGDTHFERKIIRGEKIHSIRTDAKNRWKAGRSVQHVTGNRTKNRNQFSKDTCHDTQSVVITFLMNGKINDVIVDGKHIPDWALIAKNDGLTADEFERWFFLSSEGLVYIGKIIHWTKTRY